MRKIELKSGVNPDQTRIFIDGIRLETFFDKPGIIFFRNNRRKFPPIIVTQTLDTMTKKLNNDIVNLTSAEVSFILDAYKKELGL